MERVMSTIVQSKDSSQGCVTINAAFLQEIKEANCQVWEKLHQLRTLIGFRTVDSETVNKWVQSLTEFRKLLSLEFSLEETYGYVGNSKCQHIVSEISPADALRQHRELYLYLLEICEKVEESQYVGTICREFERHVRAFQEFDGMLSEHERIESQMIRFGLGLKFAPS
jgi:hypothetical protein